MISGIKKCSLIALKGDTVRGKEVHKMNDEQLTKTAKVVARTIEFFETSDHLLHKKTTNLGDLFGWGLRFVALIGAMKDATSTPVAEPESVVPFALPIPAISDPLFPYFAINPALYFAITLRR
jgi:hypothetical protein